MLTCSCLSFGVGDNCGSGSEEACSSVSDDALFMEKLKHMGKCKRHQTKSLKLNCKCISSHPILTTVLLPTATRKKLFEIARSFSEKTRRKKSKKRALPKHQSYPHMSSSDIHCQKSASMYVV